MGDAEVAVEPELPRGERDQGRDQGDEQACAKNLEKDVAECATLTTSYSFMRQAQRFGCKKGKQ